MTGGGELPWSFASLIHGGAVSVTAVRPISFANSLTHFVPFAQLAQDHASDDNKFALSPQTPSNQMDRLTSLILTSKSIVIESTFVHSIPNNNFRHHNLCPLLIFSFNFFSQVDFSFSFLCSDTRAFSSSFSSLCSDTKARSPDSEWAVFKVKEVVRLRCVECI